MTNIVPLLIVLFVIASLLRMDVFFYLLYLLAVVYVLGRMWTKQSMRQLQAERRLVKRAFPGETIHVELRVRNRGWLPVPWVEMHDSLPVEMASPPFYRRVLSLAPRAETYFRYTLSCRKRGYYLIGPMIWRTGDLLGMMSILSGRQPPEYIIVYPRVLPLSQLKLPTHSPLALLPAPVPLFEDPSRVVGVRRYERGDSPRRIHWRATARTGELLVKRYQPAIARETVICLDLNRDDYAMQRVHVASELAIVTAASLAHHMIVQEGLGVGLITQAYDPLQEKVVTFSLPPRHERGQLMQILEVLARAQTFSSAHSSMKESFSFAEYIRRESVTFPWGSTILLITGRDMPALYDTLVFLRRRGFAVALLLVMPPPAAEHGGKAQEIGVRVFRVWREEDVETL